MRMLTDYERGFFEAVLDAEGMLTLRRLKSRCYKAGHQFNPIGCIDNTNWMFLEKIKAMIGSGSICVHQKHENTNYKPSFRYTFPRAVMREILPQLTLIVKKRQKEIVLEALALLSGHKGLGRGLKQEYTQRLEVLTDEIRTLNTRGTNAYWNKPYKGIVIEESV